MSTKICLVQVCSLTQCCAICLLCLGPLATVSGIRFFRL